MSKTSALFALVNLLALVSAAPNADVVSVNKRGTQLCGQWDTESELSGRYTLYNNLWGESGYTGSQCTQATASSGTSVTWNTKFTWAGGPYQVKSYANLDLRTGLGQQLSSISSIPTTWNWAWTSPSSDLVADVSYDMWLSTSSTGTGSSSTSSYEVMVWLSAKGGAGPAGSQIGTASVGGVTWKLFKGTVSTWTVFSFVAPSDITSFSQDLKAFLTYLASNQGVSTSQYVVQVQAGTEPFIGSATLSTSSYSVAINGGGTTNPTTSKPSTGTTTKPPTTTGCTQTKYGQCGGTGYTGCTVCASGSTCTYSNDYYSQCL